MDGFDFLNTTVGLEYCGDDEEIYLEVLEGYVEEDRAEELDGYYADKNWPEYRVCVHAIKSTSLTIGAEDLFEKAKALEFAAADEKIDFIDANHTQLLVDYRELMNKIKEAL